MPHDPTAEQVIEEWAAMVERLYGTATPTASTNPAMSAPPTKPQPTCCPATAASSTRPLHGKEGVSVRVRKRALQSAAPRRFCIQVYLRIRQRAVGMEPFMELSRRESANAEARCGPEPRANAKAPLAPPCRTERPVSRCSAERGGACFNLDPPLRALPATRPPASTATASDCPSSAPSPSPTTPRSPRTRGRRVASR
jgi:hypothetical protein